MHQLPDKCALGTMVGLIKPVHRRSEIGNDMTKAVVVVCTGGIHVACDNMTKAVLICSMIYIYNPFSASEQCVPLALQYKKYQYYYYYYKCFSLHRPEAD